MKSPDEKIKIKLLKDFGIGYPKNTILTAEARGMTLAKAKIFAGYFVKDSDGDPYEIHEKDIGTKFEIINGRYIKDSDFCSVIRKNPKAGISDYAQYFIGKEYHHDYE